MTSEIYPKLPDAQIRKIEYNTQHSEQKWFIDYIVKPEIPNILDTLSRCLDIITSKDDITLPITSSRTEQVKGIVTRNSQEFTKMEFSLHLKSLPKKFRLRLKENIEIVQLTDVLDLINYLASEVHLLNQYDSSNEIDEFARRLNIILKGLTKCNSILNKPLEDVLFPNHKIDLSTLFEELDGHNLEHYKDKLTIDFFISNGEIAIEFKSLEKVKESPWNVIDPQTGKSQIDKLRDDLKHHRIELSDILEVQEEQKTFGSQMMGMFNKFTIQDYLTRGVTFGSNVVIETESLSIHCQDPNLLSVGAKLNGLEHLVSKIYNNLEMSIM